MTARGVAAAFCALAAFALSAAPASASRPAISAELANMNSVALQTAGIGYANVILLSNARVSDAYGFAAADASGLGAGNPLWTGTMLFAEATDGTLKMTPWMLIKGIASCDITRARFIADLWAEDLQLVPDRSCSEGRPMYPYGSQMFKLRRARLSANAGVKKFNVALRSCSHKSKTTRRLYRCLRKSYNRYFDPPSARYQSIANNTALSVSYSSCSAALTQIATAVHDFRYALDHTLIAVRRYDYIGIDDWQEKISDASDAARSGWTATQRDCVSS